MKILLVEDDRLLGDGIRAGLRQAGFAVDWAQDGRAAELTLASEAYDAVVLDLGLPRLSGMQVLARARAARNAVPVLILTARDGIDDRVDGLNLGADDYIVKPFELRELVARCRALIRRTGAPVAEATRVGELRMDASRRELSHRGRTIDLTPREWSIMEYLVLHADSVVPKDKLLQAISGWDDNLGANAIEVYVSRLRGKLEGTGVMIRTVRGVGYRLEESGG